VRRELLVPVPWWARVGAAGGCPRRQQGAAVGGLPCCPARGAGNWPCSQVVAGGSAVSPSLPFSSSSTGTSHNSAPAVCPVIRFLEGWAIRMMSTSGRGSAIRVLGGCRERGRGAPSCGVGGCPWPGALLPTAAACLVAAPEVLLLGGWQGTPVTAPSGALCLRRRCGSCGAYQQIFALCVFSVRGVLAL